MDRVHVSRAPDIAVADAAQDGVLFRALRQDAARTLFAVVPMVRDHSSKGLRIASDKLKDLADYMESAQQKKG